MIRVFLVALDFLTRVPVPVDVFDDTDAQRNSPVAYSVIGVLLGGVLAGLAWWLRDASPLLGAALLLLAWVGLTGALHLDGLADSADAWVGGLGDRERTLAIMKDPRCGPAGVVALVMLLLLKFAALASLLPHAGIALLLAPLLARAGLTALFVWMPYVRSNGLGSALREAPRDACVVAIASSALMCLFLGTRGMLAIFVACAVWWLWRRACLQRLGGFTGDTAGALAEMIEVAVLVGLALTH